MKRLILILIASFFISGCSIVKSLGISDPSPEGAVKISALRADPAELKTLAVEIQKKDLLNSLSEGRLDQLRVVPILRSANERSSLPAYRLFNINEGSVMKLLGLEEADVLIAAHGYVVYAPHQFRNYLASIPKISNDPKPNIEIEREGKPLRFEYDIKG